MNLFLRLDFTPAGVGVKRINRQRLLFRIRAKVFLVNRSGNTCHESHNPRNIVVGGKGKNRKSADFFLTNNEIARTVGSIFALPQQQLITISVIGSSDLFCGFFARVSLCRGLGDKLTQREGSGIRPAGKLQADDETLTLDWTK